ncbi:MAG: hypothetical protein ACXWVM_23385 [Polyangiales bacterium]
MSMLPSPGTSDLAGQIAIVQGVDSNVFQTQGAAGETIRHPSAFTSLEASLGVFGSGRMSGDASDLRVFGRFVVYEPLKSGDDFNSRTARGGFSYQTSSRLDRRTMLVTTLLGSVGSLQAARGTDGTLTQIDSGSSTRSTWSASGSATFVIETSALTTVRALTGVDVSGTITETVPGSENAIHRGLDFVVARSRLSVTHKLDPRTFVESALLVERMHTAYVLPGADPAAASLGPIDGGAATATIGLSRLLGRETTANGALGVTFAIPQFGDHGSVLPVASAGLIHAETAWSASALASFAYALAQPRVGPGPSTTLTLLLIGKPLSGRARDTLDVVAEASGQRTGIAIGPNDGSSVTTAGGSITMRWGVGGGLGLLLGYDVRATHFVPPSPSSDDGSQPWYVRHLGFVGLSYAWVGSGAVSPMPTLARPTASPFTP